MAGIIVFSAPSAVSSAWFPPNERTTATGIALVFNNLGNAFSFLAAPGIVPDPTASNQTVSFNDTNFPGFATNVSNGCPILEPAEKLYIEKRLQILMYLGNQLVPLIQSYVIKSPP
jgi:nitrate/nitrite transporter NarK